MNLQFRLCPMPLDLALINKKIVVDEYQLHSEK